ncbi:hypothetical protein KUV73_05065 [Mameliella alba]|nr:hypothetical protein [Mameliella alba]MBY6169059.1 hypothetical protein [Mameliella alba]MBY6173720.1 hypothetical protein [Mameliella alba]
MYLLAGLMGLMALGSVAIVSIGEDEDPLPEGANDEGDDMSPASLADFQFRMDVDWDGDAGALPDDEVLEEGRSLFARMGLINMPGLEPVAEPDPIGPAPGADLLDLDASRVSAQTEEGGGGHTSAPLDFDASEDQLVIVYDDSLDAPEPELDMAPRPDNPEMTDIRLGGTVLASLPTAEAPPLESIVLVGESDAAALDLAG